MVGQVPQHGSDTGSLLASLAQSNAQRSADSMNTMAEQYGGLRQAQTSAAGDMASEAIRNIADNASVFGGDRVNAMLQSLSGGIGLDMPSLASAYSQGADARRVGQEQADIMNTYAQASQRMPDARVLVESMNQIAQQPDAPARMGEYFNLEDRARWAAANRSSGGSGGRNDDRPEFGYLVDPSGQLPAYPIVDFDTYRAIVNGTIHIDKRYDPNPVLTDPGIYNGETSGGTRRDYGDGTRPPAGDDSRYQLTRDVLEEHPWLSASDVAESTTPGYVKVRTAEGDWIDVTPEELREMEY